MGAIQDLLTEVPLSAVLKERVALADQKYERAREEIEGYKRRIADLERENETLRAQIPSNTRSELESDTENVLLYLFRTDELTLRDVGFMAAKLGIERGVLQYHLDRLADFDLAESARGNYRYGHIYWGSTPQGRRYVVERKLV